MHYKYGRIAIRPDKPDPLTRIRSLVAERDQGKLTEAEYLTLFQALSDEAQQQSTSQQCEHRRWGKRCKMTAIIWVRGKLYCDHHGAAAKRGQL